MLNNLPVQLRFKFILLAGIMIVKTEPKPDLMNLFINEFSKQANRLHTEGITITFPNEGKQVTIHFTPIFVVADSVARPILQNRLQHNGYCGCSYCYHGGQHVKGKGMKYPFLEKEPGLRTHKSHLQDVTNAKKHGSFVRGVKSESAFIGVPNIDMVWGFPLDYLHNALFGVTEQVWDDWNKRLKPTQRRDIDSLLLLIQPPRDVYRSTEKISSKSVWKATHWRSWLLFYCLPICSRYIPSNLLEHFALFVNSMFTLLKMEISEDELNTCELNLLKFVAQYEILYGIEHMTFNVHALLHLVESVRQSSPPSLTSAFPFEHNIHFCKQILNGPKSPEQQIVNKSLRILKYRVRPPITNISVKAKEFCEQIFTSKLSTKNAVRAGNVTYFGPHYLNVFNSTTKKEFERCIFENCVYSSVQYTRTRKFDDTVIILKNGSFVQIKNIYLLSDSTCSFNVRQLIVEPFFVGETRVSHIWEIKRNLDHSPVSTSEIRSKAVVLNFKDTQYVCEIPNTIEAQ